MLNVIAGQTLGTLVNGASATLAGGQSNQNVGVNISNGNLVLQTQDTILSGVGAGLNQLRTYNSQGELVDSDGWLFVDARRLLLSGAVLLGRVNADGSESTFTWNESLGVYQSTDGLGAHDTLQQNGNTWLWTEGSSGIQEYYDASGRLIQASDRFGHGNQYRYDTNGQLESILNDSGEQLRWLREGGQLVGYEVTTLNDDGVLASYRSRVYYSYDEQQRLKSMTIDLSPDDESISDGHVIETIYHYEGDSIRLAKIERSDGFEQSYSYTAIDGKQRIATISENDVLQYQVSYNVVGRGADIIDAAGLLTRYSLDDQDRLIQVETIDSQASSTIQYYYDNDDNVTRITDANGNNTFFNYDADGLLRNERNTLGQRTRFEYNNDKQLTVSYQFIEHDDDGAGVGFPDAMQVTQQLYDDQGRLAYIIDAEGRVQLFEYNALDQLSVSKTVLSHTIPLPEPSFDDDFLLANPVTLSGVEWFIYQYANVLEVSVTSYEYNHRGQVKYEYKYEDTNFAYYRYGERQRTAFHYNEWGRLVGKTLADNNTVRYTLDGLDRIIETINEDDTTIARIFSDTNREVVTTYEDGRYTKEVLDRDGKLLSTTQSSADSSQTLTTRYFYDAMDRVIAKQAPDGRHELSTYTQRGELAAQVSAQGDVVAYHYDNNGQLLETLRYTQRLNVASLVGGGELDQAALETAVAEVLAGTPTRVNQQVWDAAGQLRFVIDSLGFVTEYRYNGRGDQATAVEYEEAISVNAGQYYSVLDVQQRLYPDSVLITADSLLYETTREPIQPYPVLDGGELASLTNKGINAAVDISGASSYTINDGSLDYALTAKEVVVSYEDVANNITYLADPNRRYSFEDDAPIDIEAKVNESSTVQASVVGGQQQLSFNFDDYIPAITEDMAGLTGDRRHISMEDDRLKISNIITPGLGMTNKYFSTSNTYAISDEFFFTTEVTTSDDDWYRYFDIGIESTNSNGRTFHLASFLGYDLEAIYSDGTRGDYGFYDWNYNDTTYVIEVSINDGQSILRVYEKGQSREDALVDTRDISDWDGVKVFYGVLEEANAVEDHFYLENLSVTGQRLNLSTTVTAINQATGVEQTVSGEWGGDNYSAALNLSAGQLYTIQIDQRDAEGQLLTQSSFVLEGMSTTNTVVAVEQDFSYVDDFNTTTRLNGFIPASDWEQVESVDVQVRDDSGQVVSETRTLAYLSDNYDGSIQLSEQGELVAGTYTVSATINYRDGSQVSHPPFSYQHKVSISVPRGQMMQWAKGESTETEVSFDYTTASSSSVKSLTVYSTADFYYVFLPESNGEAIDYQIRYWDSNDVTVMTHNGRHTVYNPTQTVEDTVFNFAQEGIYERDGVMITDLDLSTLFSGLNSTADYVQIDHIEAEPITSQGFRYAPVVTQPSAFEPYQGQVNLSMGNRLPAGAYTLALSLTYKNGTVETTEIDFVFGQVTQQISWTPSNTFADTPATVYYRPLGSNSAYETTTAINHNGVYNASLPDLNPGQDYEYQVVHGRIASSNGWIESWSASSQFVAHGEQVVTLPLLGLETYYYIVTVDGSRLENVIPTADRDRVEKVVINTVNLATAEEQGQVIYPGLLDSFNGDVLLSAAGPLDDGRYDLYVTIYYDDGTNTTEEHVLEIGPQVEVHRQSELRIDKSNLPDDVIVQLRTVSGEGNSEWLALEEQADAWVLTETDPGIGRSTVQIGLFVDGQLQTNFVTRDWVDLETRAWLVNTEQNYADIKSRTTEYLYNNSGQIIAQLDASGQLTEMVYDGANRLTKTIRYYNAPLAAHLNQLLTLDDVRPAQSEHDIVESTYYDGLGNVSVVMDAGGYVTHYQYDAMNRLRKKERYSEPVSRTYTDRVAILSAAQRHGVPIDTVEMDYDERGRLKLQTNQRGLLTEYDYDLAGRETSVTLSDTTGLSDDRQTLRRYDGLGRLTSQLSGENLALYQATDEEQQEAVWSALATTMVYDDASRVLETRQVVGGDVSDLSSIERASQFVYYNAVGQVRFTIAMDGAITENEYNSLGELATTRRYNNAISSGVTLTGGELTDALRDLLISLRSSLDQVSLQTYDERGLVETQVSGTGSELRFEYNAFGEQIAQRQLKDNTLGSYVYTQFDRNARGQVVAETHSDGLTDYRSLTNEYDVFGRLIISKNAYGQGSTQHYDPKGRVIQITDADDQSTLMTYDAMDRRLTITDPLQNVTELTYADDQRSVVRTTAGGIVTQTQLNVFGETVSEHLGTGRSTHSQYDRDGKLIKMHYTDAAGIALAGASDSQYNAAGQLVAVVDRYGQRTEWEYDTQGRIVTESVISTERNLTTAFEYDAKGNRVKVTDANGVVTRMEYDSDNRQVLLVENDGFSDFSRETRFTYNESGEQLTVVVSAANDRESRTTQYTYDVYGRLRQTVVDPLGQALLTEYDYDKNDNVTRTQVADRAAIFTKYDTQQRVTEVSTEEKTLDLIDYTVNGEVEETYQRGSGRSYFIYDADGREVYRVDNAGYVIESRYNDDGQVSATFAYSESIAGHFDFTVAIPSVSEIREVLSSQPADRSTKSYYNAYGELAISLDGENFVTVNHYGDNGRLVAQTRFAERQMDDDPDVLFNLSPGTNDNTRYFVYDDFGREVYRIDTFGRVVENVLDDTGRAVQTIRYGRALSLSAVVDNQPLQARLFAGTATVTTINDLLANASTLKEVSYQQYDRLGRMDYQTDAFGVTTAYTYNIHNEIIATVRHANAAAGLGTQNITIVAAPDDDQIMHSALDNLGRLQYQLDAEGYLTEWQYTASGQISKEIRYAKPLIDPTSLTQGELASAVNTRREEAELQDDKDQVKRWYYNDRDQVIFTVDPMGYVVETNYNYLDLVNQINRYETALTVSDSDSAVTLTSRLSQVDFIQETQSYTDLGQVREIINHMGGVTTYSYNAFGQVREQISGDNHQITEYDRRGLVETVSHQDVRVAINGEDTEQDVVVTSDYDFTGQLTASYSSQSGEAQYKFYDAAGQLLYAVNGAQEVIGHRYDDFGRQIATDFYGVFVDVDAETSLAALKAQLGAPARTTHNIYDESHRAVYVVDALGQVAEQGYDHLGNLISTIRYDVQLDVSNINLASVRAGIANSDSRGDQIDYNRRGEETLRINAKNYSERYDYDAFGNRIEFIDKGNKRWEYQYNSQNLLVKEIAPEALMQLSNENSPSLRQLEKTMTYDSRGNLLSMTEAAGTVDARSIHYQYNALNSQILVERSDAGIYNEATGTVTLTGNTTRMETLYNDFNQAIAYLNERGGVEYKTYDSQGRVHFEVDANRHVTEHRYDAMGNEVALLRYSITLDANFLPSFDDLSNGTANPISATFLAEQVLGDNEVRILTNEFDALGRQVAIELGTVGGNSRYLQLTDIGGTVRTEYLYDAFGQISEEREQVRPGEYLSMHYFYDDVGNRTGVVDTAGYVTTMDFDALGNLKEKVDYSNALTQQQIAALDKKIILPSVSSELDRRETYVYDELDRLISRHTHGIDFIDIAYTGDDAYDQEVNIGQRAEDLVTETRYDNTTLVSFHEYDAFDRIKTVVDHLGQTLNTTYNDLGHKSTESRINVDGQQQYKSRYVVNAFGQVISNTTEANGESKVETIVYDRWDRAVKKTGIDAVSYYSEYDAAGNVVKEWHYLLGNYADWASENYQHRLERRFIYDANNQQIEISKAKEDGAFATFDIVTYNAFGEMESRWQHGVADVERYDYDVVGRLVQTNKVGTITRHYYDLAGRHIADEKVSELDTAETNRFTYFRLDGLGHKIEEWTPGHVGSGFIGMFRTFDRWGNITRSENAEGYVVTQGYDRAGRVTHITQHGVDTYNEGEIDLTQTLRYDILGNVVKVTDEAGTVRYTKFNNQGQQVWEMDAYGYRKQYEYDGWGNRTKTINAKGEQVIDTYNAYNQLTERGILANDFYTRMESYEYDTAGNRIAVHQRGDDRSEYTVYDRRNNVIATRTAEGYIKRFDYNDHDQKVAETLGENREQRWIYENGRLLRSVDYGGRVRVYSYNAFGEVASESFYRNEVASSASYIKTMTYNKQGWLIEQSTENNIVNHNELTNVQYSYNSQGQRTQEIISDTRGLDIFGRTINTTYDVLGRIKTVTSPRTQWTAFDQQGGTTGINNLTYHYDAKGNRMRTVVYAQDTEGEFESEDYYYSYDLENRMLISQGEFDSGTIVLSEDRGAHFSYNALGQRSNAVFYVEEPESKNLEFTKRHESYEYNEFGQLTHVRAYEDEQWEIYSYWLQRFLGEDVEELPDPSHRVVDRRFYDDAGFVEEQATYYVTGEAKSRTTSSYNLDGQVTDQSTWNADEAGDALIQSSQVSYNAASYDDVGTLLSYDVYIYDDEGNLQFLDKNVKTYTYYNSAELISETVTRYERSGNDWKEWGDTGVTYHRRTLDGTLKSIALNERHYESETGTTSWTRHFFTDGDGQIVGRVEKGDDPETDSDEIVYRFQDYFYVNGQSIGTNGSISGIDFDNNFTPISDAYPAPTSTSYVVNGGDTLRSIAHSVFGDASRWFIIAEANGLSSDEDLNPGQRLTIPNVVTNVSNNSQTFKAFESELLIGDTSPSVVVPPPPGDRCGALTLLIQVVVTYVVSYYSGSSAVGAAAGDKAGQASAAMLNGRFDWDAFRQGSLKPRNIIKRGVALLSPGYQAYVWKNAFEGDEEYLGIVDPLEYGMDFDHERTAIAAAAGFVGGQVAGQVGGYIGAAVGAGASYATNYGLNKAAGNEVSFNARAMAASMVAAGVMAKIGGAEAFGDAGNTGSTGNTENSAYNASRFGQNLDWGNLTQATVENIGKGLIEYGVKRLIDHDTKFDFAAIAVNAFGTAVGENLTGTYQAKIAAKEARKQSEAAEKQKIEDMLSSPQKELMEKNMAKLDKAINDFTTQKFDETSKDVSDSLETIANRAVEMRDDNHAQAPARGEKRFLNQDIYLAGSSANRAFSGVTDSIDELMFRMRQQAMGELINNLFNGDKLIDQVFNGYQGDALVDENFYASFTQRKKKTYVGAEVFPKYTYQPDVIRKLGGDPELMARTMNVTYRDRSDPMTRFTELLIDFDKFITALGLVTNFMPVGRSKAAVQKLASDQVESIAGDLFESLEETIFNNIKPDSKLGESFKNIAKTTYSESFSGKGAEKAVIILMGDELDIIEQRARESTLKNASDDSKFKQVFSSKDRSDNVGTGLDISKKALHVDLVGLAVDAIEKGLEIRYGKNKTLKGKVMKEIRTTAFNAIGTEALNQFLISGIVEPYVDDMVSSSPLQTNTTLTTDQRQEMIEIERRQLTEALTRPAGVLFVLREKERGFWKP